MFVCRTFCYTVIKSHSHSHLQCSLVPASSAGHDVTYRLLYTNFQGDLGPFNPGLPVEVPVWLALNLKQRQKCRIVPPEWMDTGEFNHIHGWHTISPETNSKSRWSFPFLSRQTRGDPWTGEKARHFHSHPESILHGADQIITQPVSTRSPSAYSHERPHAIIIRFVAFIWCLFIWFHLNKECIFSCSKICGIKWHF